MSEPAVPTVEPAPDEPAKKQRKLGYVLVSIEGWPEQDPGRWLIYTERPTHRKAMRHAKRLTRNHPQYKWDARELTYREAKAIERAPFYVQTFLGQMMEVQWTGRKYTYKGIPAPLRGRAGAAS